jgi:two-component system, cell cycle response regulator DivK
MGRSLPSILLVGEIADERASYAKHLSDLGYQTLEADSADEAWRLATAWRPAIVITDLMLRGGESGLDLTSRLKKDERTRAVPVIMLTARAFEAERMEAAREGVDLFLAKPCPPPQLAEEVRHALARWRVARVRPRDRLSAAKALLKPHRSRSRSSAGGEPPLKKG